MLSGVGEGGNSPRDSISGSAGDVWFGYCYLRARISAEETRTGVRAALIVHWSAYTTLVSIRITLEPGIGLDCLGLECVIVHLFSYTTLVFIHITLEPDIALDCLGLECVIVVESMVLADDIA